MPLRQSRFWMFWGILMVVCAILLFQLNFSLKAPVAKIAVAKPAEQAPPPQQESFNAGALVDFTKKASCKHNVQVINTLVEIWFLNHDGQWPKNDLSDIGRDMDYFPKGVPRCPVTGEAYRLDPVTHWVIGHDHGGLSDVQEQFERKSVASHGNNYKRSNDDSGPGPEKRNSR